ncbi:hypothetical protein SLA2020_053610 [Shorea laevis]
MASLVTIVALQNPKWNPKTQGVLFLFTWIVILDYESATTENQRKRNGVSIRLLAEGDGDRRDGRKQEQSDRGCSRLGA